MNKQNHASRVLYWYLFPALLFYTIFMAYPLLDAIRLSFFKTDGVSSLFAGWHNYRTLFFDPEIAQRFWGAFKNTWYFFFIHMVVQNLLAIIFALILTDPIMKATRIYQTILFIPVTFAVLVTGYLWKLLLNPQWGAVAVLLKFLHLGDAIQPWLGNESTALTAVALVSSWQWLGIPTMMFFAALQTIPDDVLEAADIAGATVFQKIFFIRLPMILPIIGIVTILTFVNNFNAFDVVFAMENANGAPQYSTDIMGTLFYRIGIAGQHPVGIPNHGLGSAIATVTFLLLLGGALLILRQTHKNTR